MNILLANLTYLPHLGGIENSFRHISEVYTKQGHNVIIVCSDMKPDKKGSLKSFESIKGIKVYRYKRYVPYFKFLHPLVNVTDIIKSYLLVKKLHKVYDFDFSIVRNMKVGIGVKLALKDKKVIYVLSSITKFLDKKKLNEFTGNKLIKILKWFNYNKISIGQDVFYEKILIKNSTMNVVFSKNMLNQVGQLVKIKKDKIRLITPGVDHNRFCKNFNYDTDELVGEVTSEDFIFLLLGRLINVKRVDLAIKAFANLGNINAKLLIVGDGPERVNLINLVDKLGLEERVIFVSKTKSPEKYFSISHAFLMTSTYESFGQTILEAMSSELPIIGFKPDGEHVKTAIGEIIEDKINGILCEYTIGDLSVAMKTILDLPMKERIKMGATNRKKIINHYSWERFSSSIIDLVNK